MTKDTQHRKVPLQSCNWEKEKGGVKWRDLDDYNKINSFYMSGAAATIESDG